MCEITHTNVLCSVLFELRTPHRKNTFLDGIFRAETNTFLFKLCMCAGRTII